LCLFTHQTTLKMRLISVVICLLLIINCSCNSYESNICKNQLQVVEKLRGSAFYRRGNSNFLVFYASQNGKTNEYFFDISSGKLTLKRDSLEYQEVGARANIISYVSKLRIELDSLEIKEYDGRPDGLGTLLKMHMKDDNWITFAEDSSHITYPATLQYLRKSKSFCKNWYRNSY
jgi:hypothetical protein